MSQTYTGAVSVLSGNLSGKLSPADYDVETYDGPYEVIPDAFEPQILATKNRLLKQNIFVSGIPYSETSNAAGGKTFYIG
jgi:hypothetical protein